MELDPHKPRVLAFRQLDDLRQALVRRQAREHHAGFFQLGAVGRIDLVPVAVALADHLFTVNLRNAGPGREFAVVGAQTHGAAQIVVIAAALDVAVALPLGHQADNRLVGRAEFRRGCVFDAGEVPRHLQHCHLHAEADTEVGDLPLPRMPDRGDLAARPALAEAAGHQNAVDAGEVQFGVFFLENLRIDPAHLDLGVVGDAAVGQGFRE